MGDIKISNMPDGGAVQDTDQLPVVRTGSNYRVQVGSAAALDAGLAIGDVPVLGNVGGNAALPAVDGSLLTGLKVNPLNITMNASALTLSSIPSALTFAGSSPRLVNQYDISRFTSVRMNLLIGSIAGPSGSKVVAKYKASPFTAVAADWSDIGTTEVSIALDQTTNFYYETAWIDIASLAKNNVFFGIFTVGGNGSSNPVVHNINLQFK